MARSAWIDDRAGRKTPNGKKVQGLRWRARYRTPSGQVRSKSFAQKAEARAWLDAQLGTVAKGDWTDPSAGKIPFGEWAAVVMAGRAHLAATTRSRDESYLRNLVLPHLGDLPLAAIRPAHLRAMVSALAADGKAPATVRKAYQIAALILNQAVNDDRLARTPARSVKLPSLRDHQSESEIRAKFLTHAEVARLHETIAPRYRLAVSLGAYAGLRQGEAFGLRVADLDLLRRRLTISHSLTNLNGAVSLGPTKTRSSRRTISLPTFVVDEIAAHLSVFGTGPEGVVLSSPTGSWLRASSWRHRFWRPATVAAGVGRVRFHDLRHTHASWLVAQGAHPKALQERLGHSSIVVTMDTYAHLMEGIDADLADKLGIEHQALWETATTLATNA